MPPSRPSAEPAGLVAAWRRRGLLACLLYPASLVFRLIVALRRAWIGRGERLPVPVVVVGNLTVGGAGKTPLTIELARALRERGRRPGIVSRGYGGAGMVREVNTDADPRIVGDEPLLLARRSACPVVVGRDRVAAAHALLAAHPECDLILADDGLQHYRLGRDLEIAVFDARGVQNGWLLPAGPLREPVGRLATVDAVVLHGLAAAPSGRFMSPAPTVPARVFRMRLQGDAFVRDRETRSVDQLRGLRLHAVAGIGDPQRFFDYLSLLGVRFEAHAFPDHHAYRAEDLAFDGDAILTTEKDAVKLERLALALPIWTLPVTARLEPDLAAFVLEKLDGPPSA